MTNAELIALLMELDPGGEMPVYVRDWNEEYAVPALVTPESVNVETTQPFTTPLQECLLPLPVPRIELG